VSRLIPSVAKNRCYGDFKKSDIQPDIPGAVKSTLSFNFIRDFNEFDNLFKVSYNLEASGSVNVASLLSGESSLHSFGSFEDFLKNDSDTALIVIEAYAEHGRDLLNNFNLAQTPYGDLLDHKKYSEFRALCGTHFIQGWNKRSSIRVIYKVENLDRQSKIILENTMQGSAGAKVGISDLSGSAKTTISGALSNTLSLASKLGKVSANVEAQGGKGIGTIKVRFFRRAIRPIHNLLLSFWINWPRPQRTSFLGLRSM
jgi:hypothetical protein